MKLFPFALASLATLVLGCAQTASRKIAQTDPSTPKFELKCRNQNPSVVEVIREEIKGGAGSTRLVQHTVTFRPIVLQNERVETRIGDGPTKESVTQSSENCTLHYPLQTLLESATPTTFKARVLSLQLSGGLEFGPYTPGHLEDSLVAEWNGRIPLDVFQPLNIKKEMRSTRLLNQQALELQAIPKRSVQDTSTASRPLSFNSQVPLYAFLALRLKTRAPTQMTYGTTAEPLTLKILAEIELDRKD